MDNQGTLSYYLTQKDVFEKYYVRILYRQKASHIHHLRLAIKRLRTLFMLIELASNGKFTKKEYDLMYSKLFKAAGKVRETQLNLHLVQKLGIGNNKSISLPLRNMLEENVKRLSVELQAFDLVQYAGLNYSLENHIRNLPRSTVEGVIADKVNNELSKILKLTQNHASKPDLHKLRMRIRIVKELLVLLSNIKGLKYPKVLDFKHIYNCLGNWHDHYVLTKTLRSLLKDDRKNAERPNQADVIQRSRNKERELEELSSAMLIRQYKTLQRFTQKGPGFMRQPPGSSEYSLAN